ncbi:GNAT family N-acetyltransferase [Anaerocolumna sedimenticola]|uniref:GNAT family N-acetyltransferase n=2 Tax=Anaerocolumna sedimenticola TaxID=2696063 RepID=A0A6P1TR46_9FIRM|nr:GNAT family N-acetyltransferase [Anaerocolumna sedimenticola]
MIIKRMADYDRDVRNDVAGVFVDAYYKDLSFFTKDKEKLKTAFKDTFCADIFYLAEIDGVIVGMLACANNKLRAIPTDKTSMKKGLGVVMGSIAYHLLKKEFSTPLTYPDDTAYIESVATSQTAQGKGVCTALFQYVIKELQYHEYILEVVDTNENAYRLYKKLGFTDTQRERVKHSKFKGFNEIIYMSYCK